MRLPRVHRGCRGRRRGHVLEGMLARGGGVHAGRLLVRSEVVNQTVSGTARIATTDGARWIHCPAAREVRVRRRRQVVRQETANLPPSVRFRPAPLRTAVLSFESRVLSMRKRATPCGSRPLHFHPIEPPGLVPVRGEVVVRGARAAIVDPDDRRVAVPGARLLNDGDVAAP